MNNYFFNEQADQFSFFRIPKTLFTDEKYANVSVEAKFLYGILLDRMNLSQKNGWKDKEGRVYIVFPIAETMETFGCADKKASRLLSELENAGLIARRKQGLCRPDVIYVKNFIHPSEQRFLTRKNNDSGTAETTAQETSEVRCNNTDINNTDSNKTDNIPFLSVNDDNKDKSEPVSEGKGTEKKLTRRECVKRIKQNIQYDLLVIEYPRNKVILDEIVELMLETVCSRRSTIRIAGDDKPADVVRERFLSITDEHIRFVFECLSNNSTDVKNIKQYLLSVLYNSLFTISNYYTAQVNHDIHFSS